MLFKKRKVNSGLIEHTIRVLETKRQAVEQLGSVAIEFQQELLRLKDQAIAIDRRIGEIGVAVGDIARNMREVVDEMRVAHSAVAGAPDSTGE